MGIKLHDVEFLIEARRRGVRFERTLTLGRQMLMDSPEAVGELLNRSGIAVDAAQIADANGRANLFSEWMFYRLGASQVETLDSSDYEGASLIHDLNAPIGPGLKQCFSVVYDGGTLEHIFCYPAALKNSMEMVCHNGHLLIQTPANNFFGHGFYQLSPELFYRALSEENGFVIERMVLVEDKQHGRWYDVIDPQIVERRVELINAHRVLLLVQARRSRIVEVFQRVPQQSDYSSEWQSRASLVQGRTKWESYCYRFRDAVKQRNRFGGRLAGFAVRQLLRPVHFRRRRQLAFRRSLRNTDFFLPVNRKM